MDIDTAMGQFKDDGLLPTKMESRRVLMSEPRIHAVTCTSPGGLHRMAYYEWGDADNPDVVVCVHGLTRSGRDFDRLARELSPRFRVVCPDVVGRGLSEWLPVPMLYAVPQYVTDMVTLIARLRPTTLRWVGTSMGGLIGLGLVGAIAQTKLRVQRQPPAQEIQFLPPTDIRFHRMVLNDVGPRIEPVSLVRIGQYLAEPVAFDSFDQAVTYVKSVSSSFGKLSDELWREFTRHVYIRVDGKWIKHYDPAIAIPFASMSAEASRQGEQVLWQAWDAIDCPTLVIRGQDSDLLSSTTLAEMLRSQPLSRARSFADVGHAPSLMVPDQIQAVTEFLNED